MLNIRLCSNQTLFKSDFVQVIPENEIHAHHRVLIFSCMIMSLDLIVHASLYVCVHTDAYSVIQMMQDLQHICLFFDNFVAFALLGSAFCHAICVIIFAIVGICSVTHFCNVLRTLLMEQQK